MFKENTDLVRVPQKKTQTSQQSKIEMKGPPGMGNFIFSRIRLAFAVIVFFGLMTIIVSAEDVKPTIDPHADALLKRMGDFLAQAQFFSVNAEIWQDVQLHSGQQVQAGRVVDLQVRRPNRFHSEVRSSRRNRGLYYDGTSVTLLDRVQNLYGSIPAPASLEEALDVASERFGIVIPLEDLIASDSYQNTIRNATSGIDIGPVTVLGVPCEHLAFSQGAVDWQVWIEDGAMPVPRKIVITYKDEEGSPEYTAILSHWDFQTKLPDFVFICEPPIGAAKIDVAEIKNENKNDKCEGK
ncbi:MAG: DUF2092 domain-containing protein [Candidatus Riflebacteria bacterium]|nr:DUF2092 domain-containing protein [Candidatus Riflebacteria bacterium]